METKGKKCSKCNEEKLLSDFGKNGNRLYSICKKCKNEISKKRYRQKEKESVDESVKKIDGRKGHKVMSEEELEEIREVAEIFLLLEKWQGESDSQRELSNPKVVNGTRKV